MHATLALSRIGGVPGLSSAPRTQRLPEHRDRLVVVAMAVVLAFIAALIMAVLVAGVKPVLAVVSVVMATVVVMVTTD